MNSAASSPAPFHPRLPVALLMLLLLSAGHATAQSRSWDTDIIRDTFGYGADTPSDVPWDEVLQGCGRRDCIPSIDHPRFVAASDADFLTDQDVVMALEREKRIEQSSEPGLRWQLTDSGQVEVRRLDTGESVVPHRMFWFPWYSFHLDTQLYDREKGD